MNDDPTKGDNFADRFSIAVKRSFLSSLPWGYLAILLSEKQLIHCYSVQQQIFCNSFSSSIPRAKSSSPCGPASRGRRIRGQASWRYHVTVISSRRCYRHAEATSLAGARQEVPKEIDISGAGLLPAAYVALALRPSALPLDVFPLVRVQG